MKMRGLAMDGLLVQKEYRLYNDIVFQLFRKGMRELQRGHQFRKGDLVFLKEERLKMGEGVEDGDKGVEGIVVEVRRRKMFVAVKRGSDGSERLMEGAGEKEWGMEAGTNAITFDRCQKALEVLRDPNWDISTIQRIIVQSFGQEGELGSINGWVEENVRAASPRVDKGVVKRVCSSLLPQYLNDSQRTAVRCALSKQLTLIQGPPGSGKTETLSWIVTCAAAMKKRILVVSFSNIAADNTLAAILKAGGDGYRLVRVGRPASVREEHWKYTLDAKVNKALETASHQHNTDSATAKSNHVRKKNGKHRGQKTPETVLYEKMKQVRKDAMQNAEIVVTTCVGAGSDAVVQTNFDVVVLDEACQATEPSLLISLTTSVSSLIMIGDQNQLPPTVLSDHSSSLRLSCFERLVSLGVTPYLLNTQYRMHPVIAAFSSRRFYKGKLLSHQSTHARMLPPELDLIFQDNPVLFLNCAGEESKADVESNGTQEAAFASQTSYGNPNEVLLVLQIVQQLSPHFDQDAIGIISPYSLQVHLLREGLDRLFQKPCKIEVHSVDGFQGREKDVIIFSAVRSNLEGNIGFVSDWRRLNVSLTRAKTLLVVVGDESTLGARGNGVWPEWLRWIRKQNGIYDADPIQQGSDKV